ncbi:hypothetical protein B0H14DRAFT_2608488 [Mycena olivaceomarginata]|nr:hypothetical protein B0H14DRAFT_2608488 [Mycena olivaceomarginata]
MESSRPSVVIFCRSSWSIHTRDVVVGVECAWFTVVETERLAGSADLQLIITANPMLPDGRILLAIVEYFAPDSFSSLRRLCYAVTQSRKARICHGIEGISCRAVADDGPETAIDSFDVDVRLAHKVPQSQRQGKIAAGISITAQDERAYGSHLYLLELMLRDVRYRELYVFPGRCSHVFLPTIRSRTDFTDNKMSTGLNELPCPSRQGRSCVFKCAEGDTRRKNSSSLGWILRFRAALAMIVNELNDIRHFYLVFALKKSRDNALVTFGARIELPAATIVEECLQKTAKRRKGPILEQSIDLFEFNVVDETGETVVGDGAAEGTEKIEDNTGEVVDVDGVSGGTDEAVDAA